MVYYSFGRIVTAAVGMLLGFPFSRLRALYYAMGSLFFGIGVLRIAYAFGDFTGGYSGLVGIPPLLTGSKVSVLLPVPGHGFAQHRRPLQIRVLSYRNKPEGHRSVAPRGFKRAV